MIEGTVLPQGEQLLRMGHCPHCRHKKTIRPIRDEGGKPILHANRCIDCETSYRWVRNELWAFIHHMAIDDTPLPLPMSPQAIAELASPFKVAHMPLEALFWEPF